MPGIRIYDSGLKPQRWSPGLLHCARNSRAFNEKCRRAALNAFIVPLPNTRSGRTRVVADRGPESAGKMAGVPTGEGLVATRGATPPARSSKSSAAIQAPSAKSCGRQGASCSAAQLRQLYGLVQREQPFGRWSNLSRPPPHARSDARDVGGSRRRCASCPGRNRYRHAADPASGGVHRYICGVKTTYGVQSLGQSGLASSLARRARWRVALATALILEAMACSIPRIDYSRLPVPDGRHRSSGLRVNKVGIPRESGWSTDQDILASWIRPRLSGAGAMWSRSAAAHAITRSNTITRPGASSTRALRWGSLACASCPKAPTCRKCTLRPARGFR